MTAMSASPLLDTVARRLLFKDMVIVGALFAGPTDKRSPFGQRSSDRCHGRTLSSSHISGRGRCSAACGRSKGWSPRAVMMLAEWGVAVQEDARLHPR